MNFRVAVITDKARFTGFRLASMGDIYAVEDQIEAKALLERLCDEEDIGMVVVSEHLVAEDDAEMDDMLRQSFPLVVPVPTSDCQIAGGTELRIEELLRRSIGISIKL